MSANPPITHQWHQYDIDDLQQNHSQNYALSGKIMLSSIIVLFVVVLVLVILHLYARWYILRFHLRRRRHHRRRSTRIVFYDDNNRSAVPAGLDANVLKSLPVFVYSPETDGSMPECAVCLSEFEEGEKGRVLPKCKHCFHTECIDMWFGSHSTCPLCRWPVEAAGEPEMTILVENQESVPDQLGSSNSPVQQDGVTRETTSFSDRMKRVDVRIHVPNRNELAAVNELTESSPSQGFRSPGSRLLSLKRIMNMSWKSPAMSPSSGGGSSSVPVSTESDLESARQESTQESSSLVEITKMDMLAAVVNKCYEINT